MNEGTTTRGGAGVLQDPTSAPWRACFRIGEVSLGLNGDEVAIPEFAPQLELFRFESGIPDFSDCDIELHLEWVKALAPPEGRRLFDSGSVWTLHEEPDGLLFDFASAVVGSQPYKRLHVDRDFRQGRILLNQSCFPDPAACNPLEYPLDELIVLHRLGRERGVEVHAAGMYAADGTGYLFLGHSGAGKSTTTRLWNQQHSMTVLSDDRIILRTVPGSDARPEVWMYGTPWHGEAAFAAAEKARIERLFILEHAPDPAAANRITPLRGVPAVAEIMARSFLPFYDPVALENTLSFLEEIAAAIPCYRLEFRPDSTAVEAVRRFRS